MTSSRYICQIKDTICLYSPYKLNITRWAVETSKNTHFPWKLQPGTEKDRWIRIWSQILENLKATGWIFGILWRHNHHSLEEKPHTFMPPGNYIGGNVFAEISFVGFELSKISFIFTSRIVMIVENQPYLAKMAEILGIVRNRLRRLTLVSFYAEYTTFIQK